MLAPTGLVRIVTAGFSAGISNTRGPRVMPVVAAGYGVNIVLMSAVWQLVLVSCIVGAGIGLAYRAMPSLIMAAVPLSETGAANSLNTLTWAIGRSVASAVAGVVLAQLTTTIGTATFTSQNAFRVILAVAAGASLLACALAALLPRHQKSPATDAADPLPADTFALG